MNLVLMGYMGSGKSAVGQCLGAYLHRDFIDLDQRIEEMEGLTISEIFEKKGVVYFRKRESEILRQTLHDSKCSVIALGGGTPIYGDNLKWINDAKLNFSVYLKIAVESLVSRLWQERSHRPIIAEVPSPEDLEEFVRKHLFERAFIYQQAHLVYEVADSDVASIAKGIIEASKEALG